MRDSEWLPIVGGLDCVGADQVDAPCRERKRAIVTSTELHPEYVRTVGRFAYVWGWSLVNLANRRTNITQVPAPGRLGGVVPVAPRGRLSMLDD